MNLIESNKLKTLKANIKQRQDKINKNTIALRNLEMESNRLSALIEARSVIYGVRFGGRLFIDEALDKKESNKPKWWQWYK